MVRARAHEAPARPPVIFRWRSHPVLTETLPGFRVRDAEVRPATPEERPLWDELMDGHHYLGFRRLTARLQVSSTRPVDRLEGGAAVP